MRMPSLFNRGKEGAVPALKAGDRSTSAGHMTFEEVEEFMLHNHNALQVASDGSRQIAASLRDLAQYVTTVAVELEESAEQLQATANGLMEILTQAKQTKEAKNHGA